MESEKAGEKDKEGQAMDGRVATWQQHARDMICNKGPTQWNSNLYVKETFASHKSFYSSIIVKGEKYYIY